MCTHKVGDCVFDMLHYFTILQFIVAKQPTIKDCTLDTSNVLRFFKVFMSHCVFGKLKHVE